MTRGVTRREVTAVPVHMRPCYSLCAVAFVLVSCGLGEERANAIMVAEVSSLALTTNDTLVITRALTNSGSDAIWLDGTAPGYSMTNPTGQPVCAVDMTLANTALELIHIPRDSAVVIERSYVLANMSDCQPGTYQIGVVALFHRNDSGNGPTFSLRTNTVAFVLSAP